jgi:uncharacterized protein
MDVQKKEALLKAYLSQFSVMAIAYSGGVDSSYLADVAHEVLGSGAHMILADSPSLPRRELEEALALAKSRGWNIRVVQTQEHTQEAYLKNSGDRCYHCKRELFTQMRAVMGEVTEPALAHGAIEDDKYEVRHGARAATEFHVVAPLQEAKLCKSEVRLLSEARQLPTSTKASFACLGSRFPTGVRIDMETMGRIEAAEAVLYAQGLRQYRVRHHGELCRIEVEPVDFERVLQKREEILLEIEKVGYRYITLDLQGYRSGSTA